MPLSSCPCSLSYDFTLEEEGDLDFSISFVPSEVAEKKNKNNEDDNDSESDEEQVLFCYMLSICLQWIHSC